MLGDRARCALTAVTVGLALTGCTSETPVTTGPPPTGPPGRVHHPRAEVPEDRDEQAVVAALRTLDACALLDPAAAGVPGFSADRKPRALGPHRCSIYAGNGGDTVDVVLGYSFDRSARFDLEPVTLGGAKAYLLRRSRSCTVELPVSFTRSIQFRSSHGDKSSDDQLCAAPKGFAAAAAAKLADPDAIAAGPTMPLAQWDACGALRTALGDEAARYVLKMDGSRGLDGCDGPLADPNQQRLNDHLMLEFSYELDPELRGKDARHIEIGGRDVYVADQGVPCVARWGLGPSGPADRPSYRPVVELRAPDCALAERLARSIIAVMGSAPPAGIGPQRPLTYRPDQPDVAATGACVDYTGGSDDCQPYVEVKVPAGMKEATLAAHADPNVTCAMAIDAVRTHFGDRLVPVTDGNIGACVFVEPTHTIRVEIYITSIKRLVAGSGRPVAVAGRDGHADQRSSSSGQVEHSIEVPIFGGTEPDVIGATATISTGRGGAKPDTGLSGKLQPAVADLMARFLP